jgi:hypothetical protein
MLLMLLLVLMLLPMTKKMMKMMMMMKIQIMMVLLLLLSRKKMAQLAAQTAAEEAAKREKAQKEAAAKRNPARIWVQIATGRNDSGLGLTLKRIRSDNEAALKGLSGWFVPYKATNRILVGPMKSSAAARDLVGKLAKNGVNAMTFNSDAGEEVEKIVAK